MGERPDSLNYTSLMREFEAGHLQPVYFFYGSEDVLIERALMKLREKAIEEDSEDFNWNVFRSDADDINWNEFADALNSMPLIPSHRVVVLKGLGGALRHKAVTQLLEGALKQKSNDLTLVLIDDNPDLGRPFYKELLERGTAVSFPRPNTTELQQHLKQFAADFGKEISDVALERILTETNPKLRDLLSKLEILICYVDEKNLIEPEDVEGCTAFTREVEIYKLLQAIGNRDAVAVRSICEQLLRKRLELGSLFHLLYRQIWALYRMKYLQERKIPAGKWQELLNIKPPFLQNRYRNYLSNYSRSELGRSLELLDQADQTRKSSAVQDDYILITLTENLLQP